MKFSIGDAILLKRTGEEGSVVAFLSETMMEVEVAGIRFPVYNEEVDHPYLKWFTEQKKPRPKSTQAEIPVEKSADRPQRLARGIYLSFMPQFATAAMEDIIESFRIHLINETPEAIAFSYDARSAGGSSLFQHRATLHAFGHVYLHPLSLEEMNGQPRFHWELAASAAQSRIPITGVLRIRPGQLIRQIREMLEGNHPAFSVMLSQDTEQTAPLACDEPPLAPVGNTKSQHVLHTLPEEVVDLHMKRPAGASPEQMLNMQVALLSQKLQAAMAAGMERMIVIHGIGNGRLRQRVHDALLSTDGIMSFSNRWMSGYGWGATEVILGEK